MSRDPRITPARPDLAAAHLKDQVAAERYVTGTPGYVLAEVLDMHGTPDRETALTSQLLWGEPVTIYDRAGGFAWVQSDVDGYVGYVPDSGVAEGQARPDHLVTAQAAQLYAEPQLKRPPLINLPGGARVSVGETRDGYVHVGTHWCPASLVTPFSKLGGDFVSMAERFISAPYLWGGRSARGLDCSALVQLSLAAVGVDCPRDSDMQQTLGTGVTRADQRGDLVFWAGHVAIMLDATHMIHANAHHMAVTIEPLKTAEARIAATDTGPITHIRRL